MLALYLSSDIISTLQLGEFAVPSDLPRFSSPESPSPLHSASVQRPLACIDFVMGFSLVADRVLGFLPRPPTLTNICFCAGYQDPSTETKPTRRKCIRFSPTPWLGDFQLAFHCKDLVNGWISAPVKQKALGRTKHWPMLISFRNEYRTDDIPDSETGNIPRGIDCVQCKAAP